MTVGILLLAAGNSARFGSDKRLAKLASGRTILDTTIGNIVSTGMPLLVCLRADDDVIAGMLASDNIPHLLCPSSSNGMGATLSDGITSVKDWSGVMVALADMPFILPSTYTAVAQAVRPGNICVPVNPKGRGHPVGFGQQWFGRLGELQGDRGGYSILKNYNEAVIEVPCGDPGIQHDIDVMASIPKE